MFAKCRWAGSTTSSLKYYAKGSEMVSKSAQVLGRLPKTWSTGAQHDNDLFHALLTYCRRRHVETSENASNPCTHSAPIVKDVKWEVRDDTEVLHTLLTDQWGRQKLAKVIKTCCVKCIQFSMRIGKKVDAHSVFLPKMSPVRFSHPAKASERRETTASNSDVLHELFCIMA